MEKGDSHAKIVENLHQPIANHMLGKMPVNI
jgi:hypothetical protein